MSESGFTGEQIAGYNFDASPPEGFDRNAEGWKDMPAGTHEVGLMFGENGTSVHDNTTFKVRDQGEFLLNQLRPKLRIVKGPHAGATILDFLPMPTPGVVMPATLANRWANFARSWGDDIAPGAMVPPGFALTEVYFGSRTCLIEVGFDLDENKQQKLTKSGTPQMRVKFFGYSRVPAGGHVPSKTSTTRATIPAREPAAAVTAPPDEIEL